MSRIQDPIRSASLFTTNGLSDPRFVQADEREGSVKGTPFINIIIRLFNFLQTLVSKGKQSLPS